MIITNECINCGACIVLDCEAIAMEDGYDHPEINEVKCTKCGDCVNVCPVNAIEGMD